MRSWRDFWHGANECCPKNLEIKDHFSLVMDVFTNTDVRSKERVKIISCEDASRRLTVWQ
jgi:hypothetical protein